MGIADFKIAGTLQASLGYDATHSQVLDLQLESTSVTDGARVQFSIITHSKDAPDVVFDPPSGIPTTPTGIVTCTMPASGAHTWDLQCQVDEGRDSLGRVDSGYTKRRAVAIRSTLFQFRKWLPGETTQYSARSWSDEQNLWVDALEVAFAGTFAGAFLLDAATVPSELPSAKAIRALVATLAFLGQEVTPASFTRRDAAATSAEGLALKRTVTGAAAGAVGQALELAFYLTDAGAGSPRRTGRIRSEWISAVALAPQAKTVISVLGVDGEHDYWSIDNAGNVVLLTPSGARTLLAEGTATGFTVGAAQRSGNGANAGVPVTYTSGRGQQQSGGNNNNNSGAVALRSATPGTGGGGTAGTPGDAIIGVGASDQIVVKGDGTQTVFSSRVLVFPAYTVAQLNGGNPDPTTNLNGVVICSDQTGGRGLCTSNGSTWVSDRTGATVA